MAWNRLIRSCKDGTRSRSSSAPEEAGSRTRRLIAFGKDTGGAAAVVAALVFPVVIGGMGLGAETGYWYLTQRKLQHAADTSVHAAGVLKRAGETKAGIYSGALGIASGTGFSPSQGTLTVNIPPVSGAHAGDASSIEVLVEEIRPRLFSAIFSSEAMTVKARAVARLTGGTKACVLALSKTASGAVTVSGSTSVNLTNCEVASNSNAADSFLLSGSSAAMSTDCVYTVGGAVTTAGLTLKKCPAIWQNAPVTVDPYGTVAEPAVWGTCRSNKVGSPGNPTTLIPTENHPSGVKSMRFCGGLDLKGEVRLDPGLYIVDGGSFTVNGGQADSTAGVNILGNGVTILLANGAAAKLTGNVSMSLSAPTSGPFSGILFFGSRANTSTSHQISGTTGSVLQGALYGPSSEIVYRGDSASVDGCTQVIGRKVIFTGNSTMASSCEAAGSKEIIAGQTVSIVE